MVMPFWINAVLPIELAPISKSLLSVVVLPIGIPMVASPVGRSQINEHRNRHRGEAIADFEIVFFRHRSSTVWFRPSETPIVASPSGSRPKPLEFALARPAELVDFPIDFLYGFALARPAELPSISKLTFCARRSHRGIAH